MRVRRTRNAADLFVSHQALPEHLATRLHRYLQLSWTRFVDDCAPIETYEVVLQQPATDDAWRARSRRRKSSHEEGRA